jgi:hypothetical protein
LPEEEVHDCRGVNMTEEQRHKARLGLDVVDHLEAGELVRIPVLPGNKKKTTVRSKHRKLRKTYREEKLACCSVFTMRVSWTYFRYK